MLLVLREILLTKHVQGAVEVGLRDRVEPSLRYVLELAFRQVAREAVTHPPTALMQVDLDLQFVIVTLEIRVLARMPGPTCPTHAAAQPLRTASSPLSVTPGAAAPAQTRGRPGRRGFAPPVPSVSVELGVGELA